MDARYESQEWQTERPSGGGRRAGAGGETALRLRDCQRCDAAERTRTSEGSRESGGRNEAVEVKQVNIEIFARVFRNQLRRKP